jgi:F-type H+-transporting ATPase subunit delta
MKARDVATDDPMMASVAGRYASALFELAQEQSQLAVVEGDLANIQALLDESEDLRRLVRSPVFSADNQTLALVAVLGRMGASELAQNFVKLLVRNRRLFALGDMIEAFRTLAARARGEVEADVTSAATLTQEQLEALKDTLNASLGQDVQVNTRVDPSLLGGLVVKIGSRMIDSSLRTKLASLKMRMKEVG